MNTRLSTGMFGLCYAKVCGIFIRLLDIFRYFPVRLVRLFKHLLSPFYRFFKDPGGFFAPLEYLFWVVELLFYMLDLLGIGEIIETLSDIVKFNTRPLSPEEQKMADRIFGKNLRTERIRIDESAFLGPSSHQFAYVSLFTINSWGPMRDDILVHELAHVWQYQTMGSVYIPRALRAQFSSEGYDYGGLPNLLLAVRTGKNLEHFNLEQQGDIIADYYRLSAGRNPRWGSPTFDDIWVYEHLVQKSVGSLPA